MTVTLLFAALGTALAAVPLLGPSERHSWKNPAWIVFAIVLWSLPLKALYIALLRPEPNPLGRDRLFVHADSSAVFATGAALLCLALAGYALGFHLPARSARPKPPRAARSEPTARRRLWAWLGLCAAAFVGYLITSGIDLQSSALSAKRFAPREIGVPTRFLYPPYYLLKLAATSSSLAYAITVWLCRARSRTERRTSKVLLSASVLLALAVGHFASLRLFLLLMVLQIVLATAYFRPEKGRGFLAALGLLTLSSFVWITWVERSLPLAPTSARAQLERPEPRLEARGRALLSSIFEGKYLLDVAKLSHLGHYFPSRAPYLAGRGYLGLAPDLDADSSPADATFNRYLARVVFAQPENNIPAGFAGELYVNFGPVGLALGFLGLGVFHRRILERLAGPPLPTLVAAAWLCIVPSVTVVVLNSGLVSAFTRAAVDLAVLALVFLPGARLSVAA